MSAIEEAKQSPDFPGVGDFRLVAKVMQPVAVWAENFPVTGYIIGSVVVAVVHLKNGQLYAPATALASANASAMIGTVLLGATLCGRVAPGCGVECTGACPPAKTSVFLPTCRAELKRLLAPVAWPLLTRFLIWVCSTLSVKRAAFDRTMLNLASDVADHKRCSAFTAHPRPSSFVTVMKTAAPLGAVPLTAIRRELTRTIEAFPVWLHGE